MSNVHPSNCGDGPIRASGPRSDAESHSLAADEIEVLCLIDRCEFGGPDWPKYTVSPVPIYVLCRCSSMSRRRMSSAIFSLLRRGLITAPVAESEDDLQVRRASGELLPIRIPPQLVSDHPANRGIIGFDEHTDDGRILSSVLFTIGPKFEVTADGNRLPVARVVRGFALTAAGAQEAIALRDRSRGRHEQLFPRTMGQFAARTGLSETLLRAVAKQAGVKLAERGDNRHKMSHDDQLRIATAGRDDKSRAETTRCAFREFLSAHGA